MRKLTLSIRDEKKIEWAKDFAKSGNTSLSRLFEDYLSSLEEFEKKEVVLSKDLQRLKDPGKKPSSLEIEKHLTQRRWRSASENK
jgi:hypothetical protein